MRKPNWSRQIVRHYGDTSGQQKSHYYTDRWKTNTLVSLCGHFMIHPLEHIKIDKELDCQCKICKKIYDKMEEKK